MRSILHFTILTHVFSLGAFARAQRSDALVEHVGRTKLAEAQLSSRGELPFPALPYLNAWERMVLIHAGYESDRDLEGATWRALKTVALPEDTKNLRFQLEQYVGRRLPEDSLELAIQRGRWHDPVDAATMFISPRLVRAAGLKSVGHLVRQAEQRPAAFTALVRRYSPTLIKRVRRYRENCGPALVAAH